MKKKERCILKYSGGTGSRVFFFCHPETEYDNFNREIVNLYKNKKDERPFCICKTNQIIKIPDAVVLETVCDKYYPDWRWFHSVKEEWNNG